MRQKTGRKLLSVLLTLAMLAGLMPGMCLTAYATEGNRVSFSSSTNSYGMLANDSASLVDVNVEQNGSAITVTNKDNVPIPYSTGNTECWNPEDQSGYYLSLLMKISGTVSDKAKLQLTGHNEPLAVKDCLDTDKSDEVTLVLIVGPEKTSVPVAFDWGGDGTYEEKYTIDLSGLKYAGRVDFSSSTDNFGLLADDNASLVNVNVGQKSIVDESINIPVTNMDNAAIPYSTGNTDFSWKPEEQSGYYVALLMKISGAISDDAKLKLTGHNEPLAVKDCLDTNTTDEITLVLIVGPEKTSVPVAFDWGGDGTYEEQYALDISNLKYAPVVADLTYTAPEDLTYSGENKTATVAARDGVTGMGEITVKYYNDAARTTEVTPVNVGTYYVGATVAEGSRYAASTVALYSDSWTFSITKANASVTAPTAKALTYTGSAQALVNAGSTNDGTLYYAVTTENKAPTDESLYTTSIPKGIDAGTYHVWYKVVGDENHNDSEPACVTATIAEEKKDEQEPTPAPTPTPTPSAEIVPAGTGHVQGAGDVAAAASGKGIVIGTTGESRRLEQMALSLPAGTDGGIEYRAHLQGTGWTEFVADGAACGTTGESRRMEAVQVRLTGAVAETHSVWYRVHSQTLGWLGWARDGEAAGTAGQSKRAEAVEVQVLPKGEAPEGYEPGQASYVGAVTANVHLQRTGWAGARSALEFGTTGQSRRLEAMRLALADQPEEGGITYAAHLQGTGWTDAVSDGALAGTTGQARRLEAVRINLTGDLSNSFSVWYRVHSQTLGWLGWAKDGETAGTTGLSKRAEAIDMQVLPKGQVPAGYDAGVAAAVEG